MERRDPASSQPAFRRALLVALLAAALPTMLAAESTDSLRASGPGFLFRRPLVTLSLHGGMNQALANSDIYEDALQFFTLNRSDFRAPSVGGELGYRLSERIDLLLGIEYTRFSRRSEYRDWVDLDDLPIEQVTSLTRMPFTASIKYYLLPSGRQIGSFAWVPTRLAPFVGAGGGIMRYRFEQQGDFVDFNTEENVIFSDVIIDEGVSPTAHLFVGSDLALATRLALTGQLRYTWAKARMGFIFEGFDDIDLSGVQATVGLVLRL
jgi:hypothetical protein